VNLPAGLCLDRDLCLVEDAAHPVLISCDVTSGNPRSDDGAPLPLPCLDPTQHTDHPPHPSTRIDTYEQAWQRLISRAVPQHELPSLVREIFSNKKTTDMVKRLQAGDAQAFVDVVDEVRSHTLCFRGVG